MPSVRSSEDKNLGMLGKERPLATLCTRGREVTQANRKLHQCYGEVKTNIWISDIQEAGLETVEESSREERVGAERS